MLFVCISFDYELYMGRNYVSEENVLIEPTRKINNVLRDVEVSGTFFADVCCPMCYREKNLEHFPQLFDDQIRQLVETGQDVQLHIHPNWLATTEVGDSVVFDRNSYRMHNWDKGNYGKSIKDIIENGVDYLNSIILPIDPHYRCIAFRAGGYCIQPEKEIIPTLYDAGIRIDSSVCIGFSHDGDGMYYDYRYYPKENIYMNEHVGLSNEVTTRIERGIFEVPVGGFAKFPHRLIASKLNSRISQQLPRGCGMSLENTTSSNRKTIFERIRTILEATNMLTFDSYNARSMVYMLRRLSEDESCKKKDVFISTIAHPKVMSDEHIENMRESIMILKKNKNISFVNMQEIADILQL